MTQTTFYRFLQYLQDELSVFKTAIAETLQQLGKDSYLLPVALWQYELLTLSQLDQAYDWLAKRSSHPLKSSLLPLRGCNKTENVFQFL